MSRHGTSSPAPGPDLIDGLRRRFEARHLDTSLVETHISWVLLAGAYAYKIKKPVRFGFLDFSTFEARRHFCEEELRLNRRLVAQLYVDVVGIHAGLGGPSLSGHGPVIEHALKMRRLPGNALASERLARGMLDGSHLARLARRLAAFHGDAPSARADTPYGSAERVRGDALRALSALGASAAAVDAPACTRLRRWIELESMRLGTRWSQRREAGRVREGHGDLHLANVIVLGNEVTAFDCIEFDAALRWIDVMNDVGYLVMDLMAHGRRDLAFGFLDAYLEVSGDYDGLDVLRYYLVYRAVVRALVGTLREQAHAQEEALKPTDYLRLAERLAEPGEARLLITHGLPGSGKTHVTRQLLERAGAVRLRSDVERKRLAGLAPLADSRPQGNLYTAAASEATYLRLAHLARGTLSAGYPTIVDAAFLRRAERDRMDALARELHLPLSILDCQAPMERLRERVQQRHQTGDDASEADLQVLERLRTEEEALRPDERARAIEVDTDAPLALAAVLSRWQAAAPATG